MQTISAPGKRAEAGFWLPLLRRIPRPSLRSPFLIRLRHWEYWPFKVVYFPILLYHFWLSIRARSLFFFSASNPSIETGGMLGESKFAILDRIGEEFKPKTLLVPFASEPLALWVQLTGQGLNFPLIAKPDVGERGWRVEKITNEQALLRYLESSPVDFLIQEFVDEPLELGVFYYRLPSQEKGVVSSIVQKEFLTVKGDGVQCVEGLIRRNERALLQLPALTERYGPQLQRVPDYGEVVTLVSIGNHCLGTTFLNANHLITPALTDLFDRISQPVEGFYYGRYDLRCRSVEDLLAGRHIRIMELNGAGAEPAHIYHPGASLWEAYRVLFHHWRVMYTISRENHRRGVPYMTLGEAVVIWRRVRELRKQGLIREMSLKKAISPGS
jgi:hypothetical protein